jgi:hypothetical protein
MFADDPIPAILFCAKYADLVCAIGISSNPLDFLPAGLVNREFRVAADRLHPSCSRGALQKRHRDNLNS